MLAAFAAPAPHTLARGPQLALVTPCGTCARGGRAAELAAMATTGGATLVQLRDADADAGALAAAAAAVSAAARAVAGVRAEVVVNGGSGAVAVAREVGGGVGVHLKEDLAVEVLEIGLEGVEGVVGVSVHGVETALRVLEAGRGRVGYLQVGTMFATGSHPGKVPEGVELMRAVRHAIGEDVVLLGVGGIEPGNVADVVGAGADGVAVISGIAAAPDPEAAARELWAGVHAACTGGAGVQG